ncbi:flagellar hook capping FlgD N-terminal domain-containing protein [Thioclava pacifica]|uniref:Basal-body rod modification protein FlgD n=1 Tax=Thioclava pacifica DSM 10166 TaxID=1353537 RepID=A0A074JY30_9RHOB|nr:flagellar hook capping FlgD N-terminal domain-containing protein [Thioclava pacifica]KEO54242.1 hypothetical protein TP2_04785 [Thioclava pacifica DSM 10166]
MTTTTPITASSAVTAAANSATTAQSAGLSSDFQTFLTMLTVQMQNQDPLNPIESSDYAVQLATFSGVEQQVKTNDLLQTLSTQLGLNGMSELAGWVGMQARAEAPAWFDGDSPVALSPNPILGADQAILVVSDASGATVAREAIPVSAELRAWDGRDASGATLPAGVYEFSLESYSGGTLIGTTAVETYNRITEAQGTASGPVLILEGGSAISTEAVTALREG